MKLLTTIALSLTLAIGLSATPVGVTLTNPGSLIANGQYVGPYTLDIDGMGSVLALCLDPDVQTHANQSYEATVTPLSSMGMSADAWLLEQITASGVTPSAQIGIQDAAWSEGTPGAQQWATLARSRSGGMDLSGFFLVSPVTAGAAQPFVVEATSEPRFLFALGLLLLSGFTVGRYARRHA